MEKINIRVEEKKLTYSIHLIKINDEVALKAYIIDSNIMDSCLVKINFNLINGTYEKIDTQEYALKLEKNKR